MKMLENYFYQVCNPVYSQIQCTGCVCPVGRDRIWITCCSGGLLYCFQKIQYVRSTASGQKNILKLMFSICKLHNLREKLRKAYINRAKQCKANIFVKNNISDWSILDGLNVKITLLLIFVYENL